MNVHWYQYEFADMVETCEVPESMEPVSLLGSYVVKAESDVDAEKHSDPEETVAEMEKIADSPLLNRQAVY